MNSASGPPHRTVWAWAVGTCFGAGFIKGGGTVVSVVGVAIWLAASTLLSREVLLVSTIFVALTCTVAGVVASGMVARETGRKDPSVVVVDEFAGQLIALIAAPVPLSWKYVLSALILFRALDIVKPPPLRQLERLPGGLGIMMDDVAAGAITLVVLHLLQSFTSILN